MSPELIALEKLLEAYDTEHGPYCLCGEPEWGGPCPPCVARVQLGRLPSRVHRALDTGHLRQRFGGLVDWSKVPSKVRR